MLCPPLLFFQLERIRGYLPPPLLLLLAALFCILEIVEARYNPKVQRDSIVWISCQSSQLGGAVKCFNSIIIRLLLKFRESTGIISNWCLYYKRYNELPCHTSDRYRKMKNSIKWHRKSARCPKSHIGLLQ